MIIIPIPVDKEKLAAIDEALYDGLTEMKAREWFEILISVLVGWGLSFFFFYLYMKGSLLSSIIGGIVMGNFVGLMISLIWNLVKGNKS